MNRVAVVLPAVAALLMISRPSFAAGNANARLTLHLMEVTTKNMCTRALVPCEQIVTSAPLYPNLRFAYVLVTRASAAEGISGLQFGIQYGGVGVADGVGFDVFSWTKCADFQFEPPNPAWPNSGSGTLVTWVACQTVEPGGAGTGVHAVAGYFYCAAYSPDCLTLTPRPVDNACIVANCAAVADVITNHPSNFGVACFGGGSGYNSGCPPVPVESTTWSGVKSAYSN